MTALAIMRLLPEPMARIASGTISLAGRDLAALSESAMREVRGADVAMIFQEPMTSLNPVLTVGRQLTEAIRVHHKVGRGEARALALDALAAVRIGEPERRLRQYPHELSGGMRQRVMIAMAIAGSPKVLIADEPTTALDVTVQAQILELIRDLQKEAGTAVILITHDMGVVAEMADRVIVMNGGRMVEAGPVAEIFHAPREDYTRMLLAAVPRLGSAPARPGAGGAEGRHRGGGARPHRRFRHPWRAAPPAGAAGACGRGHFLRRPPRRDAGAGGRIRLRQVDDRPRPSQPRPLAWGHRHRRTGDRGFEPP